MEISLTSSPKRSGSEKLFSLFLSFSLAFQFVLKMFAGTKKGIGVDRRPPGVTCRPRVTHQSSPSNRSILYSRSARQEYERSCPYGRSSSKFIGNFGFFFCFIRLFFFLHFFLVVQQNQFVSSKSREFEFDPDPMTGAAAAAATRSQRFFFCDTPA